MVTQVDDGPAPGGVERLSQRCTASVRSSIGYCCEVVVVDGSNAPGDAIDVAVAVAKRRRGGIALRTKGGIQLWGSDGHTTPAT
ncbi:MAG: hypothetical protein R2754_18685 [Microthrixaceae bacterium]